MLIIPAVISCYVFPSAENFIPYCDEIKQTKLLSKQFKALCSFGQRDQLYSLFCLLTPQTSEETGAGEMTVCLILYC